MTHDVHILQHWILAFMWIAAICATSFPVLYLFTTWTESTIGKLLMFQSMSFAFAVDMTLFLHYFQPKDVLVNFWIVAIVFGLIAASTASLTCSLWRSNYKEHINKGETLNESA